MYGQLVAVSRQAWQQCGGVEKLSWWVLCVRHVWLCVFLFCMLSFAGVWWGRLCFVVHALSVVCAGNISGLVGGLHSVRKSWWLVL